MAINLYRWGDTDPIYFKLTLNGAAVTGVSLANDDVKLSQDGAAFANIGTACAEVANGIYKWTPAAGSNTQCKVMIINIKDATGGPLFDENCLIITTGGDTSAGLDGV